MTLGKEAEEIGEILNGNTEDVRRVPGVCDSAIADEIVSG